MEYRLEDHDGRFRRMFSILELVATGFTFIEGPVWRGDHLLFSDIPNSRTVRYRPRPEGPEVSTFRHPSGEGNGMTLDRRGDLIVCEGAARRVSRVDGQGQVTTLADVYQGKRLNSPNDVVIRSDGSIFFTDPDYGVPNNPEKELPFAGVFRLDPDGTLHLLVDDFDGPNGLAFSPDESTLYVDDTARSHIRAFDVAADGSVSGGRVWAPMPAEPGEDGVPDGMKVDVEGHVYCTGPGGVWVFDASGDQLGRIVMPEVTANVGWGDADWRTLYMTASTSLYRMRLSVAGIAVPGNQRPLASAVG